MTTAATANIAGVPHAFRYEGEPDIPAGATVQEYRRARPRPDRATRFYAVTLMWSLLLLARTRVRTYPKR